MKVWVLVSVCGDDPDATPELFTDEEEADRAASAVAERLWVAWFGKSGRTYPGEWEDAMGTLYEQAGFYDSVSLTSHDVPLAPKAVVVRIPVDTIILSDYDPDGRTRKTIVRDSRVPPGMVCTTSHFGVEVDEVGCERCGRGPAERVDDEMICHECHMAAQDGTLYETGDSESDDGELTYTVTLTRDTTESTTVHVEAVDSEDAKERALTHLAQMEDAVWEKDDNPGGDPYVTDVALNDFQA